MSSRLSLVAALACLAGLLAADAAHAFSKREIADAAYHWGRVDLADETCENLGRNDAIRKELAETLEKAGGDAWTSGYELGRSEAKDFLEGSSVEAFCELSWAFYGRNGQTVKNLLIRQ
ncbi:MAG: hypothetical protein GC150_15785 [Rhizobiales bacterium]|nr:hypothetical protein [Hyphomicrobiales bacterium]